MNIYQWNKKYSEISNRYNALYRRVAAHFGFSDCQFKILYRLYIEQTAVTQNKLADDFSLSKQTVNSAVTRLAKMGFITLSKGTEAKNGKLISITDSGAEVCRSSIDMLIEAENTAIGRLDDERLQRFLELFEFQYTIFEEEINHLLQEEI